MRLRWVIHSPSHYNAELFCFLHAQGHDLEVVYLHDSTGAHPWKSDLRAGYSSEVAPRKCSSIWLFRKILRSHRSTTHIFGSWNRFDLILMMLLLGLVKSPFLIWTDTPRVIGVGNVLQRFVRAIALRNVFFFAQAVMGTGTPALRNLEAIGCAKKKLINFPYFINLNWARLETVKRPNKELVFLCSGRLHNEHKGYDMVLMALAQWTSARSSLEPWALRFIGTGPDRESLETLARELGIDAHVHFLGWLEPEDVRRQMLDADVFLHPARYEPYGVALIEAMAAGMVIVASTATGAALDRIVHSKNGMLHEPDDIQGLALCIREVAGEVVRREALGREAKVTSRFWELQRANDILNIAITNKPFESTQH
jgi:glycosyltransferase involved in cell wall biosynthesis